MTSDFKHLVDAISAILAALGILVTNVVTLVAGLFAIAWYTHRFHELWKEKKNGNK